MFSMIAEIARRLALRAQRRADGMIAGARHANARSEFWTDVQAWADGIEDWPTLRWLRQQRAAKTARASR